jgi:hypothetical protein
VYIFYPSAETVFSKEGVFQTPRDFTTPILPTAQMQIYSNAYISKETGDVVGYELAIKQHDDSTVDALLYVYEGAPNDDGIPTVPLPGPH